MQPYAWSVGFRPPCPGFPNDTCTLHCLGQLQAETVKRQYTTTALELAGRLRVRRSLPGPIWARSKSTCLVRGTFWASPPTIGYNIGYRRCSRRECVWARRGPLHGAFSLQATCWLIRYVSTLHYTTTCYTVILYVRPAQGDPVTRIFKLFRRGGALHHQYHITDSCCPFFCCAEV